jgi:phosphatidylserine/phosphatidylglycerophosphate/cardiolipin synthase-like enzyme
LQEVNTRRALTQHTASEDALIAAARRGVSVEVVLPPPSGSSSYAPDVARLTAGGVHVRYLTAPYMHAKLVIADGALAFTGSENFSATSLDQNREVGLMIADPAALATFGHVFALDWALAADAR